MAKKHDNAAYLAATPQGALTWGALLQGTLVRRYKRFLADVELPGGGVVTAHTANTGAMLGCSEPGRPVWLSDHAERTARALRYTWEMIGMPHSLVGVNTAVPNRLVAAAARAGAVPEFPRPAGVETEVRRGGSRLDLRLTAPGRPDTLVEIKNCTLVEEGTAFFPDAVTARGTKHLRELAAVARAGERAVIFILVQRNDAVRFSPADHIDPAWGTALREAVRDGVEPLAYRAAVGLEGIAIGPRLPIAL